MDMFLQFHGISFWLQELSTKSIYRKTVKTPTTLLLKLLYDYCIHKKIHLYQIWIATYENI